MSQAEVNEEELKQPKTTCLLISLSLTAVIGGFLFGYDTGVVSGAMLIMKHRFSLDDTWQEVIISVTVATAAVFSLVAGLFSDKLGRKATILISSVFFVTGSVILGAAENKTSLVVGRLVVGIGVGLSSATIPAYLAETSPSHVRGGVIVAFQLLVTFGLFIASVLDAAFSYIKNDNISWRLMLGVAALPAFVQFVAFIFMPESPRWLVAHHKVRQAENVLIKIYGGDDDAKKLAQRDVSNIQEDQKDTERRGGRFPLHQMMKQHATRKALVIGCSMQAFQQLVGINTIMYYSASIIQMGGIKDLTTSIWMTSITSGVNFVCTFLGVYLVERAGRRLLILGSATGVFLSCLLLGISFTVIRQSSPTGLYNGTEGIISSACRALSCNLCSYEASCGYCYLRSKDPSQFGFCVGKSNISMPTSSAIFSEAGWCAPRANCSNSTGNCQFSDPDASFDVGYCPSPDSWLPIFGMVCYLCSFSVGFGGVPWTVNAEIFPTWARSTGTALATFTNWAFNFIISMTFLTLAGALTREGAFFLYGAICAVAIIFFFLLVPETKGMGIEDIDAMMKGPWRYRPFKMQK